MFPNRPWVLQSHGNFRKGKYLVSLPWQDSGSQLSSAGDGGRWGVNRESVSEFAFRSLQWVLIPRPADPTLGNYGEETEGPEGDALAVISSSAPM